MELSKRKPLGESRMRRKPQDRMVSGLSGTERLNAFTDGVFAIVITLLVLEVRIPEIEPDRASTELAAALLAQLPVVISYMISFFLLGIYWVGHHAMFRMIKRYDRTLVWLNLLFLMFVSLMPFPVGMLIRYPEQQITLLIYCSVLIAAGLVAVLMWWHASTGYRLISEKVDPLLIRTTYRRVLAAPVIYLIAILISLASVQIAWVLLGAAILIYIVPNPINSFHIQHVEEEE